MVGVVREIWGGKGLGRIVYLIRYIWRIEVRGWKCVRVVYIVLGFDTSKTSNFFRLLMKVF